MSVVAESRKPIRLAVIQMANLGDGVQSLMALRAAKQLYPELEITYVTHEHLAEPAERIDWIEEVVALPTESLIGPIARGLRTSDQSLAAAASWIEPLVDRPFDIALNWTYSSATSFLLGLLPARVKLGYSRGKTGEQRTTDGWSHYIQSAVQSEFSQGIHLTDILTTQLLTALQVHCGEPVDPGMAAVTSKSFFTTRKDLFVCEQWNSLGRRWIALQLGGPDRNRIWDPKNWASLMARILQRHDEVSLIIMGEAADRSLETQFIEHLKKEIGDTKKLIGRVVSKVGTSNFDLWAKIIADCQWLFAADTAAIHIASVLGTRVFNISVDGDRFRETGPYGNAHYVLRGPSPRVAYGTWTYANTEWQHRRQGTISEHLKKLEISDSLDGCQIYRSRIRPTEDGGGVYFEGLIEKPLTIEDWLAQATSHLARTWYCGWVPPIAQEISKGAIHPELIKSIRQIKEGTAVLERILGEGIRSAEELSRFASKLKSETLMSAGDRATLADLGGKLEEIEGLIHRLAESQNHLTLFSRLTRILLGNMEGEKISHLGKETVDVYRFLRIGAQGFRDWADATLQLAKPKAVSEPSKVISIQGRDRTT